MQKSALIAAVAMGTLAFASPVQARSHSGHGHCLRFNKTTGTVAGAIAGGLLGNVIAGHGNRTAGTFIGGAAGGLAGHELARNGRKNCR
jgi:outer membrane lipoprotein SlyB